MKKLLMNLVKYINHFTNHEVKPEEEAKSILNFMLLRNDTVHTIRIMESLEEQLKEEMLKRQSDAYKIARAVNEKYKSDPVKPKYYDPNFDKSLNELELNY